MRESYVLTLTVPQREMLLVQAQILDAPVPTDLRETLTPDTVAEAPKRINLTLEDLVYFAELFAEAIRNYPPALIVAAGALNQLQGFATHHQEVQQRLHQIKPIPVLTHAPETLRVPLSFAKRRALARFLFQSVLVHSQDVNVPQLTRLLPRVTTLARVNPRRFHLLAKPVAFTTLEALALGMVMLAMRDTAVASPFADSAGSWQKAFLALLAEAKQKAPDVYAALANVAGTVE